MNTKIIYISGGEVFEMSKIRAAFDQVRSALGLSANTVLFGVPVDADCALAGTVTTPDCDVVAPVSDDVTNADSAEDLTVMPIAATTETVVAETVVAEPVTEPVVDIVPEPAAEIPEPESEPQIETPVDTAPDTVIPILSVLSVSDNAPQPDVAVAEPVDIAEPAAEPVEIAEPVVAVTEPVDIAEPVTVPMNSDVIPADGITTDIGLDTKLVSPIDDTSVATVSIADSISDAVPPAPTKQTLEDLLESMKPLREDVEQPSADPDESDSGISDLSDATLAQLANEFADTADTIVVPPKAESHSKISKLKHILPFHPRREEESGLMGDLLSWAGLSAANDDDVSIPGFFTTAAKK